ncbi:MAG: RidA family protein [Leptolyngbya sp. SIOISBB]|nr:RidA family protein [Leptolyngbya sp. SIOISBB]
MLVRRVSSGSPWETKVGYCRAVQVDNQIFISGTAPSDGQGGTFAPGDAYAQTKRCFAIIESALQELGADLSHIVRTRMYVTDFAHWEDFARAHQELFGEHPPASCMVAISGLINPDMLIEVEADAIAPISAT